MPFPALTSAGFSAKEDSQYFQDAPIDGAIKFETDGGIVVTRRRFTRFAGRNITTGFTWLTQHDKSILDWFWGANSGGSGIFTYVHPGTGETLNVRFDGQYTTAYKGIGITKLWDITALKLRTCLDPQTPSTPPNY